MNHDGLRGRENARGEFHGRNSTVYEYPQQLGQRGNNGVWEVFYGQSRGRHGRLGFGRGGRNGNRMGRGRGSEYCNYCFQRGRKRNECEIFNATWNSNACLNCGEVGHYSRECPLSQPNYDSFGGHYTG